MDHVCAGNHVIGFLASLKFATFLYTLRRRPGVVDHREEVIPTHFNSGCLFPIVRQSRSLSLTCWDAPRVSPLVLCCDSNLILLTTCEGGILTHVDRCCRETSTERKTNRLSMPTRTHTPLFLPDYIRLRRSKSTHRRPACSIVSVNCRNQKSSAEASWPREAKMFSYTASFDGQESRCPADFSR